MLKEEIKFYTCRYDRPFKEVFLNPNNEDLLKILIEEILNIKIQKIELSSIETINGNIYVKKKYFDAIIYTDKEKIEIEVNTEDENLVRPRNFSYICNVYQNHTLTGDTYDEKTNIIQVNLTYGMKDKELKREYKILDKEGKEYVKNFKIIEINMDKYKEICYSNKEVKLLSILDLEEKELKKLSKENKVVEKYMEEIEKVNKNPVFIEYMSHEEDERKKYNTRMKEATEKGLEKGLKQGIKQGIKEGIEQGIEQNKIEIAKKLLNKNMSKQDISEITDLSIQEIVLIKD